MYTWPKIDVDIITPTRESTYFSIKHILDFKYIMCLNALKHDLLNKPAMISLFQ